jgi:hypothetical protein
LIGKLKFGQNKAIMKPRNLAVIIHHLRPAGIPKATPRRPGRRIIFGPRILPPVIRITIPYEQQS